MYCGETVAPIGATTPCAFGSSVPSIARSQYWSMYSEPGISRRNVQFVPAAGLAVIGLGAGCVPAVADSCGPPVDRSLDGIRVLANRPAAFVPRLPWTFIWPGPRIGRYIWKNAASIPLSTSSGVYWPCSFSLSVWKMLYGAHGLTVEVVTLVVQLTIVSSSHQRTMSVFWKEPGGFHGVCAESASGVRIPLRFSYCSNGCV